MNETKILKSDKIIITIPGREPFDLHDAQTTNFNQGGIVKGSTEPDNVPVMAPDRPYAEFFGTFKFRGRLKLYPYSGKKRIREKYRKRYCEIFGLPYRYPRQKIRRKKLEIITKYLKQMNQQCESIRNDPTINGLHQAYSIGVTVAHFTKLIKDAVYLLENHPYLAFKNNEATLEPGELVVPSKTFEELLKGSHQ